MEGVECVRRGVCAYKERDLVGLEVPPVEEVKAAAGPGSWVVVESEVEGATCILLLQLFWVATPVRHTPPHQQTRSERKSSVELGTRPTCRVVWSTPDQAA